MQKKLFYIALIATLLLAACGKTNESEVPTDGESGTQTLSVYTTVYPLQYFTERIGGEHVNVQSIYPPGADEHTFDPTQKDMMALADSDLFFYIGLGLEGFVENAEKTLKGEHVQMVATAEGISEEMLHEGHDHEGHDHGTDATHDEHEGHDHDTEAAHDEHDHHHGEFDPHVWISPMLSIELATSIKDALIEEMPDMQAEFEENFQQLKTDLVELDHQFEEMAANAPSKTFFVSHAAFGYIADAYGLEQIAIAGLNSQSEPSQKQLATLVTQAKELDVKYVLFEQNVSSKLTDVIRKEIGAESLMLHNLGVLTADDVKNNEDYISLMEHNIETLGKALSTK
ncbi:zinc ABC transporter substrate-binding protein [Sporosarcina sp. ACRSM]|uniref:metal ABC transporter solute-binding protein, Zn/Mn family n=1 Tax=Sporosarcina sp. ACRSM TaxID=2918216 RepID=UPI001EF5E21C|nr:zinc ABC transporter substrate-binding protein [Sporosarcina sp. ACRSM]MCG7335976.1 zinc ABC transporter substrate-binding protein [Sporosarcina sp. ACRSM]